MEEIARADTDATTWNQGIPTQQPVAFLTLATAKMTTCCCFFSVSRHLVALDIITYQTIIHHTGRSFITIELYQSLFPLLASIHRFQVLLVIPHYS